MKKTLCIICVCSLLGILLTGCGLINSLGDAFKEGWEEGLSKNDSNQGFVTESWGKYKIPQGWEEVTGSSTEDKIFFTKSDVSLEDVYSNISVECIQTNYTEDEYQEFASALGDSMARQLQGNEFEITGYTTDQGYRVLLVEVEFKDDQPCFAKQYYIIGDKRTALIYSSDYYNANITDVDTAAGEIVNSFKWQD